MNVIETATLFNELLTFSEVVETGSFAKAALKLRTHNSTISRRIQSLEDALGVKVLIRNARKIVITDSGNLLYNMFQQQKQSLRQTVDTIQANKNKLTGKLRIAIPVMVSYDIISPYIAGFLNENPGITLEVYYLNQEIDMLDNFYDLVVINYLPLQQSLKIKKLTSLRFGFYCTPSYIEKHGLPTELIATSENHLFIGGIKDNLTIYNSFPIKNIVTGEITNLKYQARLYVNNTSHGMPIVTSGYAIAPILEFAAKDLVDNGTLVQVLPDYYAEMEYYLVKLNSTQSMIFSKLVAFIEECFNSYTLKQKK